MTGTVIVDVAGASMGGAARYAAELYGYLARTGRKDVKVIGDGPARRPSLAAAPGECPDPTAGAGWP